MSKPYSKNSNNTALETKSVPKNIKSQFLNLYLVANFKHIHSKGRAKKAILEGQILVNGKQAAINSKVFGGEQIVYLGKEKSHSFKKSYELKLDIVYEDEYLAIINKPGGLMVNGNQHNTLENALTFNLKPSNESDALAKPCPVHRLDVPTSGLVVVAKTERAQINLGREFQNHKVRKTYMALVAGKPNTESNTIETSINKSQAITNFELISTTQSNTFGVMSLVRLMPITGRTHQLRIHMTHLGTPIIGDKQYTPENMELLKGRGLFLCAKAISFTHPISGNNLEFDIPLPNKFDSYIKFEARVQKEEPLSVKNNKLLKKKVHRKHKPNSN